jgi:hypothetical protein
MAVVRWVVPFVLLSGVACNGPVQESRDAAVSVDPAADYAVLDAVLADLTGWNIFDNPESSRATRTMVVVHRTTRFHTPTLEQRRISATEDRALPRDIRSDLLRRNLHPVDISSFQPSHAQVRIDDITSIVRKSRYQTIRAFLNEYTDAKGCVHVWLPGYSADRSRAAVRFRYGYPTSGRQSVATYLMENRNGMWHVLWRTSGKADAVFSG